MNQQWLLCKTNIIIRFSVSTFSVSVLGSGLIAYKAWEYGRISVCPLTFFIWWVVNIPFNAEALLEIVCRSFSTIVLMLFDDMLHDLIFVLHLTRLLTVTVPLIASTGPLPCDVAKKFHIILTLNLVSSQCNPAAINLF